MVGGGDPLLTTEAYQQRLERGRLPETDLEGVADQLVAAGVRQITGSVIGDATRHRSILNEMLFCLILFPAGFLDKPLHKLVFTVN